jgi:AraC-like DNA-binding protein
MPHSFTSIASVTEAIARTLEKYQVDSGDLFERLELPREPYRDPDSRVPQPIMKKLWSEAERLTGNPCISFEIGMSLRATNYHAVGYACLSSASLREALERFVRYQRLLSTAAEMELKNDGAVTCLLLHGHDLPVQAIEAVCCSIVQICRDVSHPDFAPLKVEMRRPEPSCAEDLAAFMGCTIDYETADDVVCFTSVLLDEPLPRNNPALAHASEEVAQQYIARMDKNDVVSRVRATLISHLPDGEPSRKRLAEALNMSERTLARRLAEQKYTFTALVEEMRGHLAKDYLRQAHFSVTDVAFLLGFSDQSNFARAFKRWTGHSPTEFRVKD